MDIFKKESLKRYGECNYCDYLTCYRRHKQKKICKVRRKELKSKYLKGSIRQKLKKEVDY